MRTPHIDDLFLACIGTPIGSNVTEYVIVEVYCSNKTIIEFITSSPVGMEKSAILNPSPSECLPSV